jgi:hypothetical protein
MYRLSPGERMSAKKWENDERMKERKKLRPDLWFWG